MWSSKAGASPVAFAGLVDVGAPAAPAARPAHAAVAPLMVHVLQLILLLQFLPIVPPLLLLLAQTILPIGSSDFA